MAEAYLKKFGGNIYETESAGLEPGILNPLAIKVMLEDSIDISRNATNDVFEFYKEGKLFEYIFTVCDKEAAERCPIFPGVRKVINWSFEDPSKVTGSEVEKLEKVRLIRDQIKNAVIAFIEENI